MWCLFSIDRLEKGVVGTFFRNRREFAVAGDDGGRIGQGQEPIVDGPDDFALVAAGQVGAANRAGKESVAGKEQLLGREVEADAALGVARGVQYFSGKVGQPDLEAVVGAGVRRCDFGRLDAQPSGLCGHDFELRQVVLVEEDGSTGGALEQHRSADMVDVGVGDDDLLEDQAMIGQTGQDFGDIVPRVDDNRLMGGLVAQDGAVAAEGPDWKGFEDHDSGFAATLRFERNSDSVGNQTVNHGVHRAALKKSPDGAADLPT